MSRANYANLPKGQSPQKLGLGRKRKDNDIVATESENLSPDNQQKKRIEINLVDNDAGNKDVDNNKNNKDTECNDDTQKTIDDHSNNQNENLDDFDLLAMSKTSLDNDDDNGKDENSKNDENTSDDKNNNDDENNKKNKPADNQKENIDVEFGPTLVTLSKVTADNRKEARKYI